jgi:hypothetical protein
VIGHGKARLDQSPSAQTTNRLPSRKAARVPRGSIPPSRRQPDRDAQEVRRQIDHIHHAADQAIHKIAATTKTAALILAASIIVQMITG